MSWGEASPSHSDRTSAEGVKLPAGWFGVFPRLIVVIVLMAGIVGLLFVLHAPGRRFASTPSWPVHAPAGVDVNVQNETQPAIVDTPSGLDVTHFVNISAEATNHRLISIVLTCGFQKGAPVAHSVITLIPRQTFDFTVTVQIDPSGPRSFTTTCTAT